MIGNKIIKFIKRNKSGYSFIEMIVAVGIFSSMMLVATSAFQLIIQGQRSAIAAANVQETFRYILEMMGKEIRNAKLNVDPGRCTNFSSSQIYYTSDGQDLYFKNKHNQCVHYYLFNNEIFIERIPDEPMQATPESIEINSLHFLIRQEVNTQPSVTFLISGLDKNRSLQDESVIIQTTVSSRYYP